MRQSRVEEKSAQTRNEAANLASVEDGLSLCHTLETHLGIGVGKKFIKPRLSNELGNVFWEGCWGRGRGGGWSGTLGRGRGGALWRAAE